MGTLFDLAKYRKAKSFVHFDRSELMRLMNTYSRQVASGAWRDYAIDHLDGMAMFSIFRSTHETPLFTVIKLGSEHKNAGQYLALHSGELDQTKFRYQQRARGHRKACAQGRSAV